MISQRSVVQLPLVAKPGICRGQQPEHVDLLLRIIFRDPTRWLSSLSEEYSGMLWRHIEHVPSMLFHGANNGSPTGDAKSFQAVRPKTIFSPRYSENTKIHTISTISPEYSLLCAARFCRLSAWV